MKPSRRRLGQFLIVLGVVWVYAASKDETTFLITSTAAFALARELAAQWHRKEA